MLRKIYSYAVIVILTTFYGTIGLICSLVSPRNLLYKWATIPWGQQVLGFCGVKVEVEGVENIPKEPSVIMYNHQSSADIFASSGYFPYPWICVLKKELYHVPFIGWMTRAMGCYFVGRDGGSQDTQEVRKMAQVIKQGPSVMIAPEGTRSPDGKLLPFKKGGFLVAMMAKVPVVPMVIMGGRDVMPKGAKGIIPGRMKIKYFPPINVEGLPSGKEGREELMRIVRESMEGALAEFEGNKQSLAV